MEWTLLIGAGVVVLAVVLAVLRVRQLNQPHAARPAGNRPAGGSPPYYTRRATPGGDASGPGSGAASGRAEEIRAAKRRIDDLQGDGHLVPVQRRVALTLDTLPDRARRKVERLVKQGRDASAINAIRDATGAGLNEARGIVEDMRRSPGTTAGETTSEPPSETTGADVGPEALVPEPGGFARHARALKAQGRTEAAVRLVVRETGMSDDEAEAFVSALDTD